jgi:hypothetical protein
MCHPEFISGSLEVNRLRLISKMLPADADRENFRDSMTLLEAGHSPASQR